MRVRGSITIFFALSLVMFLSAVFAFLEVARVSGLKTNAQLSSMQAGDSLLAEYHRGLWDDYGVLFREARTSDELAIDALEVRQKEFIAGNYKKESLQEDGYHLLAIVPKTIQVTQYELATDNDGQPFRDQAIVDAKCSATKQGIQMFVDLLKKTKDEGRTQEEIHDLEKSAAESLKQLKNTQSKADNKKKKRKDSIPYSKANQKKKVKDNPITWMKKMKKKGVLALIMPKKELSNKSLDTTDLLSKRHLNQGNYKNNKRESMADRVWFQLYLSQRFSSAEKTDENGVLDYELEYILVGKNSDEKNLKSVVRQLLLLREGANYGFLLKDTKRQAEAEALALEISMAFLSPEFTEPLKHGILIAWAYAESISDVRALLDGESVLPLKTDATWKTDLSDLSGSRKKKMTQKTDESKKGAMNYNAYLQFLLWTKRKKAITYRTLDLIEKKEEVKMDTMIARLDCEYSYEADPLFWHYVSLGDGGFDTYHFQNERTLSYLG